MFMTAIFIIFLAARFHVVPSVSYVKKDISADHNQIYQIKHKHVIYISRQYLAAYATDISYKYCCLEEKAFSLSRT